MVHAGCVFVAGIHPSVTWMSGFFESMQWLYMCAQTKPRFILSSERVLGNGVRTHVNSQGKKSPLPEAQRRVEPVILNTAGQRANTLQTELFWPQCLSTCLRLCQILNFHDFLYNMFWNSYLGMGEEGRGGGGAVQQVLWFPSPS